MSEGYWVRGVDIKRHEHRESSADEFILGDLREQSFCEKIASGVKFDELYQLAADMGGADYIFTGLNDATIMHNSATINLNMAEQARAKGVKKLFFSSSACVYPERLQLAADNHGLKEEDAYPAGPDSEYGWEKLFSERLFLAYRKNHGVQTHVARFHNIFGPEGTWTGGKEKAPAAMCRKVAEAPDGGEIEIWGDGAQTRTFLYVDEALEGVRRLMASDFPGPVNIGSDELISINNLASMAMRIAGKSLSVRHIPGPLGVRGRSSDNRLISERLSWHPSTKLEDGMRKTYSWIASQVEAARKGKVA